MARCDGRCFECEHPDCVATDAEIAIFDRREKETAKKGAKGLAKKASDMKNAERVRKWRAAHPTYNRDWMRAYRAGQKEAAG